MRRRDRDRATIGDELATLDEARRATFPADRFKDGPDPWPWLATALDAERDRRGSVRTQPRPAWRWALGTAGLLALVGFAVLLPTLSRKSPVPVAGPRAVVAFRVDSVAIEEKPAQAFVFHTQDPDITFVWVERPL